MVNIRDAFTSLEQLGHQISTCPIYFQPEQCFGSRQSEHFENFNVFIFFLPYRDGYAGQVEIFGIYLRWKKNVRSSCLSS